MILNICANCTANYNNDLQMKIPVTGNAVKPQHQNTVKIKWVSICTVVVHTERQ
jgi:hypothetical protein